MRDENKTISIKSAIALKHSLNSDITFRGLNAREIKEVKNLTKKDYTKVLNSYDTWIEQTKLASVFLALILLFGLVVYLAYDGYWKIFGAGVFLVAAFHLTKRSGHRDGYLDGYDNGFDEGINRALGISKDENADLDERAIEMELDEMVLKQLDEKLSKH